MLAKLFLIGTDQIVYDGSEVVGCDILSADIIFLLKPSKNISRSFHTTFFLEISQDTIFFSYWNLRAHIAIEPWNRVTSKILVLS